MNQPEASIILLTFNGEQYLDEVLTSIFCQKTEFKFEVIAIDSGSKDLTVNILKKYPVKIYSIPNSEFGHGKTRNMGGRLASGKYIVFLTQDATPASPYWLENLIKAQRDVKGVVGVYSRQLPRQNCNPCEWRDIELGAPPVSIIKRVDFTDVLQKETYDKHYRQFITFSDVSSCIRKEVLERFPFNENIKMVEDQEWCKRAIEAGHAVAYEASSAVYHSHNYPISMIYRRHFDYGASFKDFLSININLQNVLVFTLYESLSDFFFLIVQPRNFFWKIKWSLKSPFVRFGMIYGLYKGLKSGC